MTLDSQSLFFSMMVNLTLMCVALTVGVRWKSHSGIWAWNTSLVLQAVGWAAVISAYRLWPRELASLGVTSLVFGVAFVHLAAKAFLHEKASRWWTWGFPAATAAAHWALFPSFAWRTGVVNAALAIQMFWTVWVLLRPRPDAPDARWRGLAACALTMSAVMVAGRAGLIVVAPESYPNFATAHWINTLGLIVNNANLTIGTLAFLLAHRDEVERELQRQATTDGLTGALNRRHWVETADSHLRLAARHGQALTVVMLDIDHFKRINDTHGHGAGDRALVLFVHALQGVVRGPDLVGRYGGEEFCVLMPQSGLEAAEAVDKRLREALARNVVPLLGFDLTYSSGAAQWAPGEVALEKLLAEADRALYRAKSAGRNRLECSITSDVARRPATTA